MQDSYRNITEADMDSLARDFAAELRPGDWVLLEGEMGVGKSTFAQKVLGALGAERPAEGSPTFAIAHEYGSKKGSVVHIDFYRLESEEDIQAAGLESYFWEQEAIVFSEWTSNWPRFLQALVKSKGSRKLWKVHLDLSDRDGAPESEVSTRKLRFELLA